MACYMIGCRLGRPGDDYIELTERIRQLGKSWESPGSTWILSTSLGAAEIRDELRPYLANNDELLVAELSGAVAWRGADKRLSEALGALLDTRPG